MKITQVTYKKLFNLGEYQHEEIGITAEPELKQGALEQGEPIMAKLILRVEQIHKGVKILQRMQKRLDDIYANEDDYYGAITSSSIQYHERVIPRQNNSIKHLRKQKKEASKEGKQDMQKEIEYTQEHIKEHKKRINELKKEGTALFAKYNKLKDEFKQGNFNSIQKSDQS